MENQIIPKTEQEIGWIKTDSSVPATIISLDNGAFLNDSKTIDYWKYCLGEPWMGTSFGYNIFPNRNSDIKHSFICEYQVVVFDDIEVGLFGFGDSPNQAVTSCQRMLIEYTQKDDETTKTDQKQEKREISDDMARMMCASRGCCAQPPESCRKCACDGGCIYQELAAQINGYYPQNKIDELQDWVDGYRATIASMEKIDENLRAEADRYKRYYFNHEYDKLIAETEQKTAVKIFSEIEDRLAIHAFTSKSEDYTKGALDAIEWVDEKIAETKQKFKVE